MSGELTGQGKKKIIPAVKCKKCGKEFTPWSDLIGMGPSRPVCVDCWLKTVPKEIHDQAFKMLTAEEMGSYKFQVNKDGTNQEERKRLEKIEGAVNDIIDGWRQGLKDCSREMQEEITRRDLELISGWLFRLESIRQGQIKRQQEEIERLKKRRPPEKTQIPGQLLNNLFLTEDSARDKSLELQTTDPLQRQRLEGMIVNGKVGLDLDVYELRVMQGIFNLTTDNPEPGDLRISSWNDLYRACGVRETVYRGKTELDKRDKIVTHRSFLRLRDRQFDMIFKVFKKYDQKTQKPVFDIAVVRQPLYETAFLYRNVAEDKIKEAADVLRKPGEYELQEIIIRPNRLVLSNYSDYYRLVDSSLYHDIRKILPAGGRVTKYDMRFIIWLHRHNHNPVQTNMEALASELGMDEYLKPRKRWDKIEKTLLRAYAIAHELGYLSKPAGHKLRRKRGGTKEVFHLNPAKVIPARQKLLPGL